MRSCLIEKRSLRTFIDYFYFACHADYAWAKNSGVAIMTSYESTGLCFFHSYLRNMAIRSDSHDSFKCLSIFTSIKFKYSHFYFFPIVQTKWIFIASIERDDVFHIKLSYSHKTNSFTDLFLSLISVSKQLLSQCRWACAFLTNRWKDPLLSINT